MQVAIKCFDLLIRLGRRISKAYYSFFREEILVLGDSHARVFLNKKFRNQFINKYFNVISIGGATVSGLKNPNSVTQSMPIFEKYIKKTKAKLIIVLLGEVDTGFVIWYRAEKNNTSVSEMLRKAVENYREFLLKLTKNFQVICISTPLPTIKDEQDWGEIANARKEVKATQKQRTELTIEFNRIINEFCNKNQIFFIQLDNKSQDSTGIVSAELLNQDPNDHHYNDDKYADLLIPYLKNIIEPITQAEMG